MASPAYSREYREWISNGEFERVHADGQRGIASAIESQRPDLLAVALDRVALCYYTRGAVALMDGDRRGWHDIQCGYLASVYSIRFTIPLPSGHPAHLRNHLQESPRSIVQSVMILALAKLFSVGFDEQLLREWLTPRFDAAALTGKVTSGRQILESIVAAPSTLTVDGLRRDRKECCQKREAWPTRPTEIRPCGILDVEMAITFPRDAEFPYPAISYSPTEDDSVIEAMAAYHQWND